MTSHIQRGDGNAYLFVRTDAGVPTFQHTQTGQLLHSHNGPYQEAWSLYVEHSGILSATGSLTLFDIGLGCGTQVIAFRDAFYQNPKLKELNIISFDLETEGIKSLVKECHEFPFATAHLDFLRQAQLGYSVEERIGNKKFSWKFCEGNFAETIFSEQPQADIFCYDFFSVSAHPHLWTYQIFKRIYELSNDKSIFLTYSTATSVRAALLACGFFVGESPDLTKNTRMTTASPSSARIESLLGERWKVKFNRSSLPFSPEEDPSVHSRIRDSVNQHPQFSYIAP